MRTHWLHCLAVGAPHDLRKTIGAVSELAGAVREVLSVRWWKHRTRAPTRALRALRALTPASRAESHCRSAPAHERQWQLVVLANGGRGGGAARRVAGKKSEHPPSTPPPSTVERLLLTQSGAGLGGVRCTPGQGRRSGRSSGGGAGGGGAGGGAAGTIKPKNDAAVRRPSEPREGAQRTEKTTRRRAKRGCISVLSKNSFTHNERDLCVGMLLTCFNGHYNPLVTNTR